MFPETEQRLIEKVDLHRNLDVIHWNRDFAQERSEAEINYLGSYLLEDDLVQIAYDCSNEVLLLSRYCLRESDASSSISFEQLQYEHFDQLFWS